MPHPRMPLLRGIARAARCAAHARRVRKVLSTPAASTQVRWGHRGVRMDRGCAVVCGWPGFFFFGPPPPRGCAPSVPIVLPWRLRPSCRAIRLLVSSPLVPGRGLVWFSPAAARPMTRDGGARRLCRPLCVCASCGGEGAAVVTVTMSLCCFCALQRGGRVQGVGRDGGRRAVSLTGCVSIVQRRKSRLTLDPGLGEASREPAE